MVIDIGDQRVGAGFQAVTARRQRRVVEHAKAHAAGRFGVVSGRPDQRERRAVLGADTVERRERAAGCARRCFVAAGIDGGVAG